MAESFSTLIALIQNKINTFKKNPECDITIYSINFVFDKDYEWVNIWTSLDDFSHKCKLYHDIVSEGIYRNYERKGILMVNKYFLYDKNFKSKVLEKYDQHEDKFIKKSIYVGDDSFIPILRKEFELDEKVTTYYDIFSEYETFGCANLNYLRKKISQEDDDMGNSISFVLEASDTGNGTYITGVIEIKIVHDNDLTPLIHKINKLLQEYNDIKIIYPARDRLYQLLHKTSFPFYEYIKDDYIINPLLLSTQSENSYITDAPLKIFKYNDTDDLCEYFDSNEIL